MQWRPQLYYLESGVWNSPDGRAVVVTPADPGFFAVAFDRGAETPKICGLAASNSAVAAAEAAAHEAKWQDFPRVHPNEALALDGNRKARRAASAAAKRRR